MDAWLPFIPPMVVFITGLITHRVVLSLFVGVILASLVADAPFLPRLTETFFHNLDTEKLWVIAFIYAAGLLFELVHESHSIEGLFKLLSKNVKCKKSAETTGFIMSLLLMFDGILSTLMVSSLLRPLGERYGIAKIKSAFIANSMGAPLTILCPVSCFTVLFLSLLPGTKVDGIFLSTLPYFFYTITLLATIGVIIRKNLSFGKMRQFEEAARTSLASTTIRTEASPIDFAFPMVVLILSMCVLMLFHESVAPTLGLSSIIALLCTTAYYLFKGMISWKGFGKTFLQSIKSATVICLMILLAWMFADLLVQDLHIDHTMTSLIPSEIPHFLFPLLLFWISSGVAIALGTLWGSAALLIPIFIPVAAQHFQMEIETWHEMPLVFPILGAIVSGATFGDHISLVSDTTLIASTRTRCHVMDLVKVQWTYTAPIFIATSFGFLLSGLVSGWLLPLCLSISLSIGIFYWLSKNSCPRTAEE